MTAPVSRSNIAIDCWLECKAHPIIFISASFDPSTVSMDTHSLLRPSRGRRRYDINVYAGKLEVRPPGAPTTRARKAEAGDFPVRWDLRTGGPTRDERGQRGPGGMKTSARFSREGSQSAPTR